MLTDPSSVTEVDFTAARQAAYGCLSAMNELRKECSDISMISIAISEIFGERYEPNVFVTDELRLLPPDQEFSRITRSVEYLCKAVNLSVANSPSLNWNGPSGPGVIGEVGKWLLAARAEGPWRGYSNTAHEKAFCMARDLMRAIDLPIIEEPTKANGYVASCRSCLSAPELIEQNTEQIRELVPDEYNPSIEALKCDVDWESARALTLWRADADPASGEEQDNGNTARAWTPASALCSGHAIDMKKNTEPDGPIEPDSFCWNGKVERGLQRVPFRLINELWHACQRTRCIDDLAMPVWDRRDVDDIAENALRTACSKIQRFFKDKKIPLGVKTYESGRYVRLMELRS